MESELKKCTKCGEVKVLSCFHKQKAGKYGVRSVCKPCRAEGRVKHYAENREAILERSSKYYAENRESILERTSKYYAENRDRYAEWKARHYTENRESCLVYATRYYAKNKDKIAKRQSDYLKRNPDKITQYNHRRRARKANAKGSHTAEQLKARFDYHGNKCVYCNSTDNLHADHQIPLSRGGTNFASNMVPACASCNCSKNDKTPIEFADYTFKQLQAMLGK